jgi:tetratricopeptide (TPR) repeat protein
VTFFRGFIRVFECVAAAVVLAAAAQPALYQLRVSYRQTDRIFEFWLATLALVVLVRLLRTWRGGISQAFGSHHALQVATTTATSTLALFLAPTVGTIDTAGVHPAFAYLHLPAHLAIVAWITWRTDVEPARSTTFLLAVLAGINLRLFTAESSVLLPLAMSAVLRVLEQRSLASLAPTLFERGLLGVAACGILGTLAAPQPDASYIVWVRFAFLVLLMILVAATVRTWNDARAHLLTQIAIGLAVCVFTVLVGAIALQHATPRAVFNTRFQIFNAHPNLVGPFHAVNALLVLGFILYLARSRYGRWLGVIAFTIILGVVIQGASKAAVGALCAGSLLLFLLGRSVVERGVRGVIDSALRNRRRLVLAATLLVVLLGAFFLAPRGMRERMTPAGIRQTLEYRIDVWSATLDVIAEHPWFGVGIENYSLAAEHLESTTAKDEVREPHPHNLYLAVAQATGLPGLGCLIVALVSVFTAAIRAHRIATESRERFLLVTCGAAIVLILVASLLDVGLGLGTFLPPSLLVLGAIITGLSRTILARERTLAENEPIASTTAQRILVASIAVIAFAVLSIRPAIVQREISLARIAHRTGSPTIAHHHYQRARALDPFNPTISNALVDVYRALGGNAQDRRVNLDRAYGTLEAMARRTPGDASLYYRMALIRREQLDADAAIRTIRTAIDLAPDTVASAPYYIELGILLWAGVKDLDGCFEAFKKALLLDIGSVNAIPWVRTPRGNGFDDQRVVIDGVRDPAKKNSFSLEDILASILADYERKFAAGEAPNVLEWLKLFHMYLNAGDYDEAYAVADRIGRFPNYHLATIAREFADVEFRRGNVDAAIEFYRQGLSERPNFAMYRGIARALRAKGDLALARANLEASLSLKEDLFAMSSEYRETYRALAEVCEEQGDRAASIRYRTRLLFFTSIPSDRLPTLIDLARLQRSLGDRKAARASIESAIDALIAGIDLVQQGLDDPVRQLAREAVLVFGVDTGEGRRMLKELSDPDTQQSASPAFSVFAAWCRFALDDLAGAHAMLARSREENRVNRLADLAAIDFLIAGGRRDDRNGLFSQLGEIDVKTQYRSLREGRLKARFDSAKGELSPALRLEVADHYFVANDMENAERHYRELATKGPPDSRIDLRLARALFFLGDIGAANAVFQRAIATDPNDPFLPRVARGVTL